jgi:hypothetical protein
MGGLYWEGIDRASEAGGQLTTTFTSGYSAGLCGMTPREFRFGTAPVQARTIKTARHRRKADIDCLRA